MIDTNIYVHNKACVCICKLTNINIRIIRKTKNLNDFLSGKGKV